MSVFWRRVFLGVAGLLSVLWLGLVGLLLKQGFPSWFASAPPKPSVAARSVLPNGSGWAPLDGVPGVQFRVEKVQSGDTYASLAKQCGLAETTLRSLNQANDGSQPKAGSSLLIPSRDGIFHVAAPGQGLSDIARAYGIPLKSILESNRLSGDEGLVGRVLVLPGAAYLDHKDVHWLALQALSDERGFLKPTTGRFADGFGPRINPISGKKEFHPGLDLAPGWHARVVAAQSGEVVFAGIRAGYGRLIILDHGGGLTSRYAHLDQILVKLHQRVQRGDLIGRVGMTGMATGPHLHFEVRLNDVPQNPLIYLTQ
ncbi:MAG TPA: M23 family metallopeptidase [bacterium]|nr:M23 family metallopeptidase [bacterium]